MELADGSRLHRLFAFIGGSEASKKGRCNPRLKGRRQRPFPFGRDCEPHWAEAERHPALLMSRRLNIRRFCYDDKGTGTGEVHQ